MMQDMNTDEMKSLAGASAAQLVKDNMVVGLGTGSTAAFFIRALIERIKNEGLVIQAAVSSSKASSKLATDGGIKVVDINDVAEVDLTVDGADEVDKDKRMIKGGGGALLREKILASSSKETVIIVDEDKISEALGRSKLPVEIVYYGSNHTEASIRKLGYEGNWRKQEDGSLYVTENGNIIFDIQFSAPIQSPEQEHDYLIKIPGVVETGFFFDLANRVIVGHSDGNVEIL